MTPDDTFLTDAEVERLAGSPRRAVQVAWLAERQHGMKFAQALAAHKSPTTTEIYLRDRVAKVVQLGV